METKLTQNWHLPFLLFPSKFGELSSPATQASQDCLSFLTSSDLMYCHKYNEQTAVSNENLGLCCIHILKTRELFGRRIFKFYRLDLIYELGKGFKGIEINIDINSIAWYTLWESIDLTIYQGIYIYRCRNTTYKPTPDMGLNTKI